MTLGFIGVGHIAGAVITGLCTSPGWSEPILLSPRSTSMAAALAARFPLVSVAADNQAVIDGCGRLVLAVRPQVAATVLGVLDDPVHAELFGPGSLGEAPISAVVAGGYVIAGTVDRLLVAADRVRVIDFKTGRRVPLGLDEVPIFHLRQMAAYAEALRVIFPGRRVEAALLYTASPRLFDLPDALLAAHKPGFVATEQS